MPFHYDALILFTAASLGGILGAVRKISTESLHLFLALAAGVFLGATCIELIPAALRNASDPHISGSLILLGFFGAYVVELLFAPMLVRLGRGAVAHDLAHYAVAVTTLLGLCLHSLTEGAALAVGLSAGDFGHSLTLSVALHHGIASISLASLFLLAGASRGRIFLSLLVFALSPLVGMYAVNPLLSVTGVGAEIVSPLTAVTAGIFLYVATVDILPEVMHSRAGLVWKLTLLVLGAGIVLVAGIFHLH